MQEAISQLFGQGNKHHYQPGDKFIYAEDLNRLNERLKALERVWNQSLFQYTDDLVLVKLAERLYSNDIKYYSAYRLQLDVLDGAGPLLRSKALQQNNYDKESFDYVSREDTTTDPIYWFRNPLYFTGSIGDRAWIARVPYLGNDFYLIQIQCPDDDENTDADPFPPTSKYPQPGDL